MEVHTCNYNTQNSKQEDFCELEAILGYLESAKGT